MAQRDGGPGYQPHAGPSRQPHAHLPVRPSHPTPPPHSNAAPAPSYQPRHRPHTQLDPSCTSVNAPRAPTHRRHPHSTPSHPTHPYHHAHHAQAPSPLHHYLPLPPLSLRTPAPPYRAPHLLTTYSHRPDRVIEPGDGAMAYYRACPLGADLKYGLERQVERDLEEEEHLDGLCEAIWRVWEEGGAGERRGGIITWRGMITRIMTAPYDRDAWEMTAVALDGSVYVELHDPPDVRAERAQKQGAWALQSYMGYAFESYSTVPGRDGEGADGEQGGGAGEDAERPEGWSGDVNQNVQWCNVVRSAVGDVPLCLGGEVDCVKAEPGAPHPGLNACVELKTNMVIGNPNQERTFHKKLLKHWAQSYLLGIPTVEVGFRDQDGFVRSLREFDTLTIPRFIAATPDPQWHPTPALVFLHTALSLVLQHVLPSDPVLRLSRDERAAFARSARARATAHPEESDAAAVPLPPAPVWRLNYVPRRGCELFLVEEREWSGVRGSGERWGGVLEEGYVRWRLGGGAGGAGVGGA